MSQISDIDLEMMFQTDTGLLACVHPKKFLEYIKEKYLEKLNEEKEINELFYIDDGE